MDNKEFKALLKRYDEGRCSPEEKAWVETWFLRAAAGSPELQQEPDYERIDKELRARIGMGKRFQQKQSLFRWLAASAAAFLLAAAGYYFIGSFTGGGSSDEMIVHDIEPGTNRATLTLTDGSVVQLSTDRSGIIVGEDIRYDDGTTIDAFIHHPSSITHHALTTPRGGQYHIRLPDGTKVWLNAETTLSYPSDFTGKERIVELSGEAFFDVYAIRDKPFKVRSAGQEITVLGTEFNVHAYGILTKTTLASGSVLVEVPGSDELKQVLNPGEQSILQQRVLTKKKVNAAAEITWKDGLFSYADASLEEVLQDLARWYDLEEFAISPGAARLKLDAEISRDLKLSEVLKLLELSVPVEITLKGRRLTVK